MKGNTNTTDLRVAEIENNPNILVGGLMSISVTWNQVGWTEANNIDNPISIPAVSGYKFIGMLGLYGNTYRIVAPYVKLVEGNWSVYFYVINTAATSGKVIGYPIYKKN